MGDKDDRGGFVVSQSNKKRNPKPIEDWMVCD
jgi:hypothetical protein